MKAGTPVTFEGVLARCQSGRLRLLSPAAKVCTVVPDDLPGIAVLEPLPVSLDKPALVHGAGTWAGTDDEDAIRITAVEGFRALHTEPLAYFRSTSADGDHRPDCPDPHCDGGPDSGDWVSAIPNLTSIRSLGVFRGQSAIVLEVTHWTPELASILESVPADVRVTTLVSSSIRS